MIDVLDSIKNPAGKTSKAMFASIEKTVMKDIMEAEVDTRKQLQNEKKMELAKVEDKDEKGIDEALNGVVTAK